MDFNYCKLWIGTIWPDKMLIVVYDYIMVVSLFENVVCKFKKIFMHKMVIKEIYTFVSIPASDYNIHKMNGIALFETRS